MRKFLFWIEHHWLVPILILIGYVVLSSTCFYYEDNPWWFIIFDAFMSLACLIVSLAQYFDWKFVFKRKYQQM